MASVWTDGRKRKDEKKERRKVYSQNVAVKSFTGSIVGEENMIEVYYRHSAEIKCVAFLMGV